MLMLAVSGGEDHVFTMMNPSMYTALSNLEIKDNQLPLMMNVASEDYCECERCEFVSVVVVELQMRMRWEVVALRCCREKKPIEAEVDETENARDKNWVCVDNK